MNIKYINIGITINGLEIRDRAAIDFLVGWLREATFAALMGKQKDQFRFKGEPKDDIKVGILELTEKT